MRFYTKQVVITHTYRLGMWTYRHHLSISNSAFHNCYDSEGLDIDYASLLKKRTFLIIMNISIPYQSKRYNSNSLSIVLVIMCCNCINKNEIGEQYIFFVLSTNFNIVIANTNQIWKIVKNSDQMNIFGLSS